MYKQSSGPWTQRLVSVGVLIIDQPFLRPLAIVNRFQTNVRNLALQQSCTSIEPKDKSKSDKDCSSLSRYVEC